MKKKERGHRKNPVFKIIAQSAGDFSGKCDELYFGNNAVDSLHCQCINRCTLLNQ
jgi:hypothetical protein